MQDLVTEECSLFVADDNLPAIRLYERLGFARADYPEDEPSVRLFTYMIASAKRIGAAKKDEPR